MWREALSCQYNIKYEVKMKQGDLNSRLDIICTETQWAWSEHRAGSLNSNSSLDTNSLMHLWARHLVPSHLKHIHTKPYTCKYYHWNQWDYSCAKIHVCRIGTLVCVCFHHLLYSIWYLSTYLMEFLQGYIFRRYFEIWSPVNVLNIF